MKSRTTTPHVALLFLAATLLTTQAQLIWTVGVNDNGWPAGDGGGANATFVQENNVNNPLPGVPNSPEVNQQADNDYYFAGVYTNVISSIIAMYGNYTPLGVVAANEEAAERAFVDGNDNNLRYHFNLPETLQPTDLLSVTFDVLNLHTDGVADPRYGVEVYFNGVMVQPEIVVRPPQLNVAFKSAQFSLASVNAGVGPGFDNIVTLKGINYDSEGGGNWMGVDYVQLNKETNVIPVAVFPWSVGSDDDGWPVGDGGGANATFVQESGTANALPGSAASPETAQQADDDYYFAGSYTITITGNGTYTPVGLVPVNEEAVERGFSGTDNELRFHFNLPNNLAANQKVAVTFDALSLDTSGGDPRYGVEVYVNNVLVQPELLIRPADLGKAVTTLPFTVGGVNAQLGAGFDNIITLRGINYGAQGGGNALGFDYVKLDVSTNAVPSSSLPWSAGKDDDDWPFGTGGGPDATFVESDGAVNTLPGDPANTDDFVADNDYYFAGAYTTVISGNGAYSPVGIVPVNERSAEGQLSGADNELRYHFNFPNTVNDATLLEVTFDPLVLGPAGSPKYGVQILVNNVLVQPEIVLGPAQVGVAQKSASFTLASVNGRVGAGYDNILTVRGVSYASSGGSDSMKFDYLKLGPRAAGTFPWFMGRNDNTHIRGGNGGGRNASFMQENGGINALPGRWDNPETDGQEDNDYYFAGEYTTALPGVLAQYPPYTPLGVVVANEEGAERAFAGADNDLRYHFNLPDTLDTNMPVVVTLDALDLDGSAPEATRRYGVEVYFNGVLVATQRVVTPSLLGQPLMSAPFTLGSVDARLGPGPDNIVSLKGINYSAEGGGAWMGIDYVQLTALNPSPFPWAVGRDDDGWPAGDGGGPNTSFVGENGNIQPLPGSPASPMVGGQADNDYYFAGVYNNVIPGNGTYTPVGLVPVNEEAAERAFANADTELRYHFNLPNTLSPSDQLVVTFDANSLDDSVTNAHYGVEVYFNGVLVQPNIIVRTNDLGVDFTTPAFTLASVNAQVGSGYDNIVTLKGTPYIAESGGNWMGIDYIQLNPAPLQLLTPVISGPNVELAWSGVGQLEWAPTVLGPWTPVTPAPTSPYSEAIVSGQNRFFRLKK